MFLRKLHQWREFSVISFDGAAVRGGRFHRKGRSWKMTLFAVEPFDGKNPAAAWKKVQRAVGLSEFCVVTGALRGAAFFRFKSAEMESRAQRGAVEFELPRHLLKVPEHFRCQFCRSGKVPGEEGEVWINVAVLPEKSVGELTVVMRRGGVLADEFIHPLMALDEESDTLILPEIDEGFCYSGESWMPLPDEAACRRNDEAWAERFRSAFVLPDSPDFSIADFKLVLLAAKVVVGGEVNRAPDAFRVLPDAAKPVRFRRHLIVSALLVVLLIAAGIWRFMLVYGGDIEEYRRIVAETKQLKSKSVELKRSVKRNAKEQKEMARLVGMSVGEPDAVAEFALLSETLPSNVLVSSVRWNETDIDMVLQCENDKLDIPSLIQPLRYWKVGSQQQRQTGDSAVATITLKLIPYDAKVTK